VTSTEWWTTEELPGIRWEDDEPPDDEDEPRITDVKVQGDLL
jgi:hypothetical protein